MDEMNLILITIDCLRADHLSCLGYSKRTTPNLDYLASNGALFTQAISVSDWTPQSFVAILTSTYPQMYRGELHITNRRTTIAQVLKDHGYHTAAFHSNPFLSSYHGYHKGFDTFDDSIPKNHRKSTLSKAKELAKSIMGTSSKLYKVLIQIHAATMAANPSAKAQVLNKKAISWLHDNPNNFFLWIHYMDVHGPYYPQGIISPFERYRLWKLNHQKAHTPEEINELIHLYDAEVSYVDEMIGSFWHILKRNNVLDNTFVIVTADHGEEFMEHGHYGHGSYLYDELIHVPLIIVGPGLEGQVISQQVSLLDLAPTILDILKIEKPKAFLGNSLFPLINGNRATTGNSEAISETQSELDVTTRRGMRPQLQLDAERRMISIRTSKWKYIYTKGKQDQLYDLEDDQNETKNVIDIKSEIAAELRAKIMAHIEFKDKSIPNEEAVIKERVRQLRGSGKI